MSGPSNSTPARAILLFGQSGQIGQALSRLWRSEASPIHAISWKERSDAEWKAKLDGALGSGKPVDLVFANGLTDARLSASTLEKANLEFPRKIFELARGVPDTRFLTLGTIQENFPDLCSGNPYLKTKLELGRWAKEMSRANPGRLLHVRLHTVYGGGVKPHMFLGQMITALKQNSTFEMSSGDQLREYHHVDDVARSLKALLTRDWKDLGSFVEITSGAPVKLADLARAVFTSLGKESLLKIGSLRRASSENVVTVFPRSPEWLLPESRDPIMGVTEMVRRELER